MLITEENYLLHYGILRKSGRYPWGSGEGLETIPQRSKAFLDYVQLLKTQGVSEANIAKGVEMTTSELRAAKTIARNQSKQADIDFAQRLKDKQYSNSEIGRRMGIPESSVRNLLKPGEKDKADQLFSISNMLKEEVAERTYVDVGKGVERRLSVSREKLDTAIAILKEDGGYVTHNVQVPTGPKTMTTVKVLAPNGTTYMDVKKNLDKIQQIKQYSEDNGRSFLGLLPPKNVDSKRVGIAYKEDGGDKADGVIYVRPGVPDLSMGKAQYAQVRIAVDGTHYLKGMAMYKNDLPKGVDLVFNTNKSDTGNKLDAMKKMETEPGNPNKIDMANPFGSIVRQLTKRDADGNDVLTSAMNLVNEEGSWDDWSRSLSSQMLSKQSPKLAKEQLDLTYEKRQTALKEIQSLTNPSVKKKLLEAYADEADSASVHLKAAAMPRQRSQVILPVNSMKVTEVYAPNFRNGERVVLIRHPHGGIFEIPELIVNNKNREAKSLLGQAKDAIGIHSKVAERLSGADFDGDTVLVIPNDGSRVKTAPALVGLKNFDPKSAFPAYEGMPKMSSDTKQAQMGSISNLITDMTLRGARSDEIAQAVRHSMVVIDAEKHNLNYRESARVNNISALKKKYQGGANKGASTLISRASARQDVRARKLRPASQGGPVDPKTGKLVYVNKGDDYVRTTTNPKTGVTTSKIISPMQRSKKLAETDDANTLSSGTVMEKIYADHSNKLKSLANEARREAVVTKPSKYSPAANKVYAKEVASLDSKLNIALQNAPLERQARLIANKNVSARKASNPNMEDAEIKKLEHLALKEARLRMGAGKERVEITQKEWDAIQAGAISPSKLDSILTNADLDSIRKLAAPKAQPVMSSAETQRAQSMLALGFTQAEIADAIGVSLTTLKTTIA